MIYILCSKYHIRFRVPLPVGNMTFLIFVLKVFCFFIK